MSECILGVQGFGGHMALRTTSSFPGCHRHHTVILSHKTSARIFYGQWRPLPSFHVYSASSATAMAVPELRLGEEIPVRLEKISFPFEEEKRSEELHILMADCDAVMQMYIDAGMGDRDPYWTEAWPSSVAMARELMLRSELVAGRRVADLGCGLGLAGTVAGLMGANEVVFLDREPLALQLAMLNARLNGLSIAPGVNLPLGMEDDVGARTCFERDLMRVAEVLSSQGLYDSKTFDDNCEECTAAVSDDIASASAHIFDWSQPVSLSGFDVVLACDVLYESFSVEPVAKVAPQLLKPRRSARDLRSDDTSTPRFLLTDPPHRARRNRERFLTLLSYEGFVMEEYTTRTIPFGNPRNGKDGVDIEFCVLRRGEYGDTVGVKLEMPTS